METIKIKILRAYGGFKKGDSFEVDQKTADFFIQNQVAKKVCDGDCKECEDCKGKKKKKAPVKKTTKTTKKASPKKK